MLVRLKLVRNVGLMQCARLGQSARTMLAAQVFQWELVQLQKRKPPSHVIAIGSVQAMRVVVQRQMMVQHSSVVQAVLLARMEDTTIAQGWPSGQPVGPMTSAKANIVREMEVVFKEENVNPLQSRRESLVARTRSVEARPVEGRQQLTMLHLCVVMRWSRGQAMTTAIICPRDLFAGLMISVYLVQAIAKGMDMGSKEASALRAYSDFSSDVSATGGAEHTLSSCQYEFFCLLLNVELHSRRKNRDYIY